MVFINNDVECSAPRLLVATQPTVMLRWHCVQEREIPACLSLHVDLYAMVSAI